MEAHNYAIEYVLDTCDETDVPEEVRKEGDELLIDLVRSRPYLYDKISKDYRDAGMKQNAGGEIASVLDVTPSECQTRFLRLRQKFCKERQFRETETRSGAGKPKRPTWILYDSMKFLSQHVMHRRTQGFVSGATGKNIDAELSQHYPEQSTVQQRSESHVGFEEEVQGTVGAAGQQCVSSDTSDSMMSPRSCAGGFQRRMKRARMDPVEVAFERMNTTLSTMADTFSSGDKAEEDPDMLIGKLVTAELKKATGSRKDELKKTVHADII